jgi:DNA-binding transcriptional LysR family regulator
MLIGPDKMPRIKLHHLRYFAAIASEGSLHGAARALGLAQPALTKGLRELEEEMGISLVKRHSHGVDLTGAGQQLLTRATSILEDLRRAQEEANDLKGVHDGEVTVGLSPTVQLMLLPMAYQQFARDYPGVRLQIVETKYPAVCQSLADGSMDFFVGENMGRSLDRHFQVTKWWSTELVVAVRRGHPMAGTTDLALLLDQRWLFMGLGTDVDDLLAEMFTARGLRIPRGITISNSVLAFHVLSVYADSDALQLVPKPMLGMPCAKQRMVILPLKEKIPGQDVLFIRRSGVPLTPVAERFASLLCPASVGNGEIVKIAGTYKERSQILHSRREGQHTVAALAGQGADFRVV